MARSSERLDELVKLNQEGAKGAKKPDWVSTKPMPKSKKFKKGGMVDGRTKYAK